MSTTAHTLLIPNQVDEVLAAHFAALGVGTSRAGSLSARILRLWTDEVGLVQKSA